MSTTSFSDFYKLPSKGGLAAGYETCLESTKVDESLAHLRLERYVADSSEARNSLVQSIMHGVYYAARPLLPVGVRKHLQRARLKGWDAISFPSWPVDLSADRLAESALAKLMRCSGVESVPFIWFWPQGYRSCTVITHDVEAKSGRDFIDELMDVDDSFGFKSSFQIVPEGRYAVPEELVAKIKSKGFEVNVHDFNHDGHLFSNGTTFIARAAKINDYCRRLGARGFRSAVLYRNLGWYDAFDFSYDMSVPNVAHLDPQRGGCCTLMPYFIGDILELPLTTIQDYSLFHILGDYTINLWKKQLDVIYGACGLACLNVHPDYLVEKLAMDCYKSLLSYLSDERTRNDIWYALPGEVNDWWRARNQLDLVMRGTTWQIEGEGSDRATVAYARLVGDELIYTDSQRNIIKTMEPDKR